MNIALIKEHGGLDKIVFESRPVPHPKENEVLVKVKACGLNHLDIWVRKGVPGHKFPLPMIPGSDFSGVVEKIGLGVEGFKTGDRVIVNPGVSCGVCDVCVSGEDHLCSKWGLLGESADGGMAEYVTVSARNLHHLPTNISFEQGATIPIAYVTAWQMLVEKAKIKMGQTVLIHAAGSGVSVACIQIAKLFKSQIFVTSHSEEKLQRAKNLGAHRFILTSKDSFRESVKNHTSKAGVDIVVDHVGEPTFTDSLKCLKKGGTLVSCGATAGADLKLDWKLVFFKNLKLLGSTYGSRKDFISVLRHFEKGNFTAQIDTTLPLNELSKAHELIESRKTFGKVVIVF